VPRQTLFRFANKINLEPQTAASAMLGRKTVEGEKVESQSVNRILIMEAKFYGLTRLDLRRMAYQLAKRNNIQHGAIAGRAWLDLFPKRHTELPSVNQQEHLLQDHLAVTSLLIIS
jgi:hypothetical protein